MHGSGFGSPMSTGSQALSKTLASHLSPRSPRRGRHGLAPPVRAEIRDMSSLSPRRGRHTGPGQANRPYRPDGRGFLRFPGLRPGLTEPALRAEKAKGRVLHQRPEQEPEAPARGMLHGHGFGPRMDTDTHRSQQRLYRQGRQVRQVRRGAGCMGFNRSRKRQRAA